MPALATIIAQAGPGAISEAAALLAAGGLVAFPTETVYGLGADASNNSAVAKLYAAKERPSFNPMIAHVADLAAARRLAQFNAEALALAEAFWPGPLTLVLPKLHTTVEFVLPPELRLFADPRLNRRPVGHETVNGIATTKYDVEVTVPEGHGNGSLWLSNDNIPMKLDGTFTRASGRVATLHWELTHVHVGPQAGSLFEPPAGVSKLPAEAITPLLGLKLKGG